MTHPRTADVPQPELAEVQQHTDPDPQLPTVPVAVSGPVQVQQLPHRLGVVDSVTLVQNAAPEQLLVADRRRARAVLVAAAAFNIRRGRAGKACAWPANVALVVEHADELWGSTTAADATVTIITEYFAD